MKFIVSKSILEQAVKNICRVINKTNALPILGDIWCKVEEQSNTLTILGSDAEIWLSYLITIEGAEGEGMFCVGADLLSDALAELKEQPLEIIADTENGASAKFRINHESGNTTLPMENADEYPLPQKLESENIPLWTLPSGMIKRALKRSMYAVANDDLRPIMCGVCFDLKEGWLNIVASNGHCLIKNSEQVVNYLSIKDRASFIMPKKVAKMVPELLDKDNDCDIMFDEKMGSLEQCNMTLQFRLIEGTYPNYNSVIPESNLILKADRKALLTAIRNVAHFASSSSRMVSLEISTNQTLTLKGEDYDFSTLANDTIDIEYPHEKEMTIGANADRLIDSLSRLFEPTVEINFTDPSRAFLINPVNPLYEGEEITMLLMPMMVNS